jgi:hypothetical protein
MYFKAGLAILSVLFIISCGTEERGGEIEIPEMKFFVNSEILGESIHDSVLNVVFNPPMQWEPLQDDLFAELLRRVDTRQGDWDSINITPVHMFINSGRGSSLTVSTMRFRNGSETENLKSYDTSIREHFNDIDLLYTVFVKDGIYFHQYLLQNDDMINFKLLTQESDGTMLQWDYVVPRQAYTFEVRAIESSIGSIKRIN